jgi:quercetin dioxygenase-like cupin family protein
MSNNEEINKRPYGKIPSTVIHQLPKRYDNSFEPETKGDNLTTMPLVNLGVVANMFVRQMVFEKVGYCEHGHEHTFDHLTLLASGKLLVEVNEQETEFQSPCMIYIKKDVTHKLTALEDNTVAYCIHGLRDTEKSDDILDPNMVPKGIEAIQKHVYQMIK